MATKVATPPRAGCEPAPPALTAAAPPVAAAADAISPLQYMLEVMRDPQADLKRRDDMAKTAAPYVHARIGAAAGDAQADGEPFQVQIVRFGDCQ
jgi:hypothetical protein